MELEEKHRKAQVDDLKASLKKFNVPKNHQKELLKVLATTHDLVVTR
jgi:hypothetical protein